MHGCFLGATFCDIRYLQKSACKSWSAKVGRQKSVGKSLKAKVCLQKSVGKSLLTKAVRKVYQHKSADKSLSVEFVTKCLLAKFCWKISDGKILWERTHCKILLGKAC